MFRKVAAVYTLDQRRLIVWFAGGEARIFDASSLITEGGSFVALADPALFARVHVAAEGFGISWDDKLDLTGNELYRASEPAELPDDERARILTEVAHARKERGFSQQRLEEAAGVRQPIIARLEAGSTAPRLDTLVKVLAPLGKTLKVVDLAEAHNPRSA